MKCENLSEKSAHRGEIRRTSDEMWWIWSKSALFIKNYLDIK